MVGVVGLVATHALAGPVVSDMQVAATGEATWVVTIRSTEPLPFDDESNDPAVARLRLHGATLGAVGSLGAQPFGTIRVRRSGDDVVVRVTPSLPGSRVRVRQGSNAGTVEVTVER